MQSVSEIINGQPAPAAGQIVRQEFGATEVQHSAETSAHALAEREKATIAAMFLVADGRRRRIPEFEAGLLAECERPGFAEIARYRKPQRTRNKETGEWEEGFVEGWSIRFAEAALRNWKNTYCDAKIVFEDDAKRIIRFMLIDLESNLPLSTEIQLSKTVERRGSGRDGKLPPKGRDIRGQRVNVAGQTVFIVDATDDELYMKQAAAFSKFRRNALTFMPGDILDAALSQVQKTLKGQSPEAARDRLVLGFDQIGVTISDLQEYLGHSISKITDAELAELRGVYTSVKTEEMTWEQVLEHKKPGGDGGADRAAVLRTNVETMVKAGNIDGAQKLAADTGVDFAEFEPKTHIQQSENGGVRTAEPVATESASGKTESPAGDRNNSEIPPSTGPGPAMPKEPRHFPELRAWRETIGGQEFHKILGAAGFEELGQVTANAWPEIEQAFIIRAKDLGKEKIAAEKPKKGFGGLGVKK